MNIFLDDDRVPKDVYWVNFDYSIEWEIVRLASDFKSKFIGNNVKLVSFDHDICCYDENGQEINGYDLFKWMIYYCIDSNIKFPDILVHSKNIVGESNIKSFYENAKKHYPELIHD